MNKLKGTIGKTPKLSGEIKAQIVTVGTGEDGATFIPAVSENGVISWTNDKGLENPQPVNIKGPQGLAGKDGTNGKDGKDGHTPIKGTDYWNEADKAEIVEDVVEQIGSGGGGGGDATNAVLFTRQNLTEAEKAQARANIGAVSDVISWHNESIEFNPAYTDKLTIQVTNFIKFGKMCYFCIQFIVNEAITDNYGFRPITLPFKSIARIWINNGTQYLINSNENQIMVNDSAIAEGNYMLTGFYFTDE